MSSEYDSTERREAQSERPFQRAARFGGEPPARSAYLAAERSIADALADISAYRFLVNRIWHVAVIADQPPAADLTRAIDEALKAGEQVALPAEVLATLLKRHRDVMRHRLPWVEGHYHPGRRLPEP
jgi:hypothetical protein